MKKALLTCALGFAAFATYGQISTYVMQPADLAGPLDFSMADGWGSLPDMSDPGNRVQAFTTIVDDGSGTTGNQGCGDLVNGSEIAGKIAIVYRGTCEFGLKALNAQNAGAAAVIVVNNAPGAAPGMAAGTNGGSVTIPVVSITQDGGAFIHDEVVAGNVEIMIGSIIGMLPNNMSLKKERVLIPTQAARPQWVSTSDDNFAVEMGGWVYNYGSDANDATLKATVTHDGSTVYDQTSASISIDMGDSAFMALPNFTQANGYLGRYEITYTAEMGSEDEFPSDNTYATSLTVGDLVSYAPIGDDGLPIQDGHYRPSDPNVTEYKICGFFSATHGSRLLAEGVYASAAAGTGNNIEGELLTAELFEVNGETPAQLSLLLSGEYSYEDSTMDSKVVYIPFSDHQPLVNDQEYLFCVSTSNLTIYLGHSNTVNYTETEEVTQEDNSVLIIDGGYSRWSTREVQGMALKTSEAPDAIHEYNTVDLTPYPNPTNSTISIPLSGQKGKASVEVMDAKGAKVADRQVVIGGDNILSMDMGDLQGGVYTFRVLFENGMKSTFRVVLTK